VEGRSKRADQYEPVSLISQAPSFFITLPDAPFKTFNEMVAWAKANPGKLVYGNNGIWSVGDIMWKAMELQLGFKSRIVDYTGGGQALVALLGGHVQVILNAPPQSFPQIKAGKVRPLGFTGAKRHPDLSDLPTIGEQGFDAAPYCSWKGILAPKGTPRPVIDKLAAAFKKMMEDPSAQPKMKQLGEEYVFKGPDEFRKFLQVDFQMYSDLAKTFKK
jgi:tripartite-type tricarboxylate transporter receptor subunit TctC